MKIGILSKGDKVLSVTKDFIAVERKSGEVDIIPIVIDEAGPVRVDTENIVTIGYGKGFVEQTVGNVTITTF